MSASQGDKDHNGWWADDPGESAEADPEPDRPTWRPSTFQDAVRERVPAARRDSGQGHVQPKAVRVP